MSIELQKLFLDSPFDEGDFTDEELKKIEETKEIKKEIKKEDKKDHKKLKLNIKK